MASALSGLAWMLAAMVAALLTFACWALVRVLWTGAPGVAVVPLSDEHPANARTAPRVTAQISLIVVAPGLIVSMVQRARSTHGLPRGLSGFLPLSSGLFPGESRWMSPLSFPSSSRGLSAFS